MEFLQCRLSSGEQLLYLIEFFFFSSRRRHTRFDCDWSSDVCSSDLPGAHAARTRRHPARVRAPGQESSGGAAGFAPLMPAASEKRAFAQDFFFELMRDRKSVV